MYKKEAKEKTMDEEQDWVLQHIIYEDQRRRNIFFWRLRF